jgi:hypothetical protein
MGLLDGKWNVTIIGLFQPWKVLNVLGDVKVIDGYSGYNEIAGHKWGFFEINTHHNGDRWLATLDYNIVDNPEPLRQVLDEIRQVNEDRWEGELQYYDGKSVRRGFEFRLDRIKE